MHTYHSHTCICMCLTCIEQCFYCPCVTRFLCAQRMCSARLRTCAFVPFAGQLWHALACFLAGDCVGGGRGSCVPAGATCYRHLFDSQSPPTLVEELVYFIGVWFLLLVATDVHKSCCVSCLPSRWHIDLLHGAPAPALAVSNHIRHVSALHCGREERQP